MVLVRDRKFVIFKNNVHSAIGHKYDIDTALLSSKTQELAIVKLRKIAQYLLCQHYKLPVTAVARIYGQHPNSVWRNIQKVEETSLLIEANDLIGEYYLTDSLV